MKTFKQKSYPKPIGSPDTMFQWTRGLPIRGQIYLARTGKLKEQIETPTSSRRQMRWILNMEWVG